MGANDNLESIAELVELGKHTADISERLDSVSAEDGIPFVLLDRDQHVENLHHIMVQADKRAPAPRRRTGTATHTELDSFCAHVNRFKGPDSAIFAHEETLTAVLNYHPADGAAWGDHRSVYTCPLSDAWLTWTEASGRRMTQTDFADFLDAHSANIHEQEGYPTVLDLLEMAKSLRIYTKGTFERSFDKRTGDHVLISKRETTEDSTKIPRAFMLALPVFEGSAIMDRIEARLVLKVEDGSKPGLSFVLHNVQEVLRKAFGDVREAAQKATSLPLFAGTPE